MKRRRLPRRCAVCGTWEIYTELKMQRILPLILVDVRTRREHELRPEFVWVCVDQYHCARRSVLKMHHD